MTWSTVHDEMLCQEILVVVDPFTGTKKGTVARGTKREEVAENLKFRKCTLNLTSGQSEIVTTYFLQLVVEFHFL